jgi:HrpA-like RNA helicase
LLPKAKKLGLAPGQGSQDPASAFGFLASALSPPHPLAVANALELLTQLGALGGDEQLTPLGHLLAALPLEPRLGKMLLWSQLLGVHDPALTLACAMASKDVFTMPTGARGQQQQQQPQGASKWKREFSGGLPSDQLANLRAVEAFNAQVGAFSHRASMFIPLNN